MTDILGNPREGQTDKGAYEYIMGSTSTLDFEEALRQLTIYPNPVGDVLNYSLENEWRGEVVYQITDLSGRATLTGYTNKTDIMMTNSLSLSDMGSGVYVLSLISQDGSTVVRSFVKE